MELFGHFLSKFFLGMEVEDNVSLGLQHPLALPVNQIIYFSSHTKGYGGTTQGCFWALSSHDSFVHFSSAIAGSARDSLHKN